MTNTHPDHDAQRSGGISRRQFLKLAAVAGLFVGWHSAGELSAASRFSSSVETNTALRQHWSALMRSGRRKELSAAHHILYLALVGKDWRKGFAAATNRSKLENGAFPGWAMFRALAAIHNPADEPWLLAPFGGIVTRQMLQSIRSPLPAPSPYAYRPEQFARANFPFEAYVIRTT